MSKFLFCDLRERLNSIFLLPRLVAPPSRRTRRLSRSRPSAPRRSATQTSPTTPAKFWKTFPRNWRPESFRKTNEGKRLETTQMCILTLLYLQKTSKTKIKDGNNTNAYTYCFYIYKRPPINKLFVFILKNKIVHYLKYSNVPWSIRWTTNWPKNQRKIG